MAASSAFSHRFSQAKRRESPLSSPTDTSSTNHLSQSFAHSTPLSSLPPTPITPTSESRSHGSLRRSAPLDPIDCIFGVGGWTKELQKPTPTLPSPSRTPDTDGSLTPSTSLPRRPATFSKSPNLSPASSVHGISLQSAESRPESRPLQPTSIKEAFADVNLSLARDSLRREEAIRLSKTDKSRSRSSSITVVSDASKSVPNSRRASSVDLRADDGHDSQFHRDNAEFIKHLIKERRRFSAPLPSSDRSRSTSDITLRPAPPNPPINRERKLSTGRLQRSPALSRTPGVPDRREWTYLGHGTYVRDRSYGLQRQSSGSTGSLVSRDVSRRAGTSPIDPVYIPRHLRSTSMYELPTMARSFNDEAPAKLSKPTLPRIDTTPKSPALLSKLRGGNKPAPWSPPTPKRIPINLDDPVSDSESSSSRPPNPRRASTGNIPPPQPIDYPAPVDILKGSSYQYSPGPPSSARSSSTALSSAGFTSPLANSSGEIPSLGSHPNLSRLSNVSNFASERVYNEVEEFRDLYTLIPPANTTPAPDVTTVETSKPLSRFRSLKKPLTKWFRRSRSVGDVERRRPESGNISGGDNQTRADDSVWRNAKVVVRRAKSFLVTLKKDVGAKMATPVEENAPQTVRSAVDVRPEAEEEAALPDEPVAPLPNSRVQELRKSPSISEGWRRSLEKVQSTLGIGEGSRGTRNSIDAPSQHVTAKSVQLSPFSFQSLTLQFESNGGGMAEGAGGSSSQASHFVSRAESSLEKWTQELIQMASHDSYAQWWDESAGVNAPATTPAKPGPSSNRNSRVVSPNFGEGSDTSHSTILAVGVTARRVSFGV